MYEAVVPKVLGSAFFTLHGLQAVVPKVLGSAFFTLNELQAFVQILFFRKCH
jgi:hypothetical protein